MQRIAIAEKYRELYEKQAKEKQIEAGGDKKSDGYQKSLTPDLGEAIGNRHSNETNTKLAKVANVGKETYRQAKKILDSGDEELKKAVMSQEMSIHADGGVTIRYVHPQRPLGNQHPAARRHRRFC